MIAQDDHSKVHFSDMTYVRPDTTALRKAIEALEKEIAAGSDNADALVTEYGNICAQFNAAESAMSLAYLLYAFDVTAPYYEQEYSYLQSELNAIDLLMTDVSVRLFESSEEARQLVENKFGSAYLDTVYEEESLNSEAVQSLQEQELMLVNEYNRVSNDFVFTDRDGKTYTMDDLFAVTDNNAYFRLYDGYMSALNDTVGDLYIEMVGVRAEIAKKLGYGSYAAYMYDAYGRDYTLEDACTLHAAVKKYIVPVYLDAFNSFSTETYGSAEHEESSALDVFSAWEDVFSTWITGGTQEDLDDVALSNMTFPLQPYLATLKTIAADFSPNLYTSLCYMLESELYDFSVNPKKMSGSFTTYISEYDAPFIFSQWGNDAESVHTVIHELGHFTNYYRNPSVGWSAGDSLDLAEVDSQGLELLATDYYDRLFGDLAPVAERELLIDAMYALLSGCMEDEFQQEVYANPDMTLSDLNALYRRLSYEYGFDELYGYTGKEWVEISHTFQSPMYYISYAVSMVPSLELWRLSQTDMNAAKTAYFRIVDRAPYASFQTVLAENGLPDVFAVNTLSDIAELLQARVN